MALFRVAFGQWLGEHKTSSLEQLINGVLDQLCVIVQRPLAGPASNRT